MRVYTHGSFINRLPGRRQGRIKELWAGILATLIWTLCLVRVPVSLQRLAGKKRGKSASTTPLG